MNFDPAFWSGRMFPACSLPTLDEISRESYGGWPTSGIAVDGACWTRDTSESPNDGAEYSACSLADVLEPQPPLKYSLSPRACAGILRRAVKRGKELPEALRLALEQVASEANGSETPEDRTV